MRKTITILFIFLVKTSCPQIVTINTGTKENLYTISKIGGNVLIASTYTFLAKCYDGCDNLIQLNLPVPPDQSYLNLFERPDTSVMYLNSSSFSNLNLVIWKSSNAGHSWVKKFDTTSTDMYDGVTKFFDAQTGLTICSNQKNIVTHDGFSSYHFTTGHGFFVTRAKTYGDSTIIQSGCGGGGGCGWGVSFDRGVNWPVTNGYSSGINAPMSMAFLSKDTFFVVTNVAQQSSFFFSTFNRGLNWNTTQFTGGDNPPPEFFFAICVKNKNEIYLTGRNGLQGGNYAGYGVILKSSDQGKTWVSFATPFKENLYDMSFLNDSTALVCGGNGLLFKWNTKRAIFTSIKEDRQGDFGLKLFPNPVKNKIKLDFGTMIESIDKIALTNELGQDALILHNLRQGEEIDLSSLRTGVYYMKVEGDKKSFVVRIIKE